MSVQNERDYVLGTNDEEIARLGLQHDIWRDTVLNCWSRAGIAPGWRVMDVGAGPGFATVDLAELVGPVGRVIAVERSDRFAQAARDRCAALGHTNVEIHQLDLMNHPLPASGLDATWCRWVASFVQSPSVLARKLAHALKVGGTAIFHEYIDYSTWRLAPPSRALEQFVQRVMDSWRANGGEPDIARTLPSLLTQSGFHIRSAVPRVFCARPGEPVWQWPASFVNVNLNRLLELGRVDEAWAASVRSEFKAAESNPASLMITPLLLEIIAERNSASL
jgi:ubiquinone/menaquinone biosynthesis C-methylase UbiE